MREFGDELPAVADGQTLVKMLCYLVLDHIWRYMSHVSSDHGQGGASDGRLGHDEVRNDIATGHGEDVVPVVVHMS